MLKVASRNRTHAFWYQASKISFSSRSENLKERLLKSYRLEWMKNEIIPFSTYKILNYLKTFSKKLKFPLKFKLFLTHSIMQNPNSYTCKCVRHRITNVFFALVVFLIKKMQTAICNCNNSRLHSCNYTYFVIEISIVLPFSLREEMKT